METNFNSFSDNMPLLNSNSSDIRKR